MRRSAGEARGSAVLAWVVVSAALLYGVGESLIKAAALFS